MSKRAALLNSAIMTAVFDIVFTVCGQMMGLGHIDMATLLPSLAIGFLIGFAASVSFPCARFGELLAEHLGITSTRGVGSCINLVFSVVMTIVLTFSMTVIGMSVWGGTSLQAALAAALNRLPSFIVIAFAISQFVGGGVRALVIRLVDK